MKKSKLLVFVLIAAAIAGQDFVGTQALADAVKKSLPARMRDDDATDAARRVFQALRIAVNDDLGELERALDAAEEVLGEGGRLAVDISFA